MLLSLAHLVGYFETSSQRYFCLQHFLLGILRLFLKDASVLRTSCGVFLDFFSKMLLSLALLLRYSETSSQDSSVLALLARYFETSFQDASVLTLLVDYFEASPQDPSGLTLLVDILRLLLKTLLSLALLADYFEASPQDSSVQFIQDTSVQFNRDASVLILLRHLCLDFLETLLSKFP